MTGNVEIRTGEKTVLSYLLKPIFKSREAFREHNTLNLSLVDVLNLGETDLFQHDGKQQMMVNGKDGDTVDLSNSHIAGLAEGEWEQHGTTQVGGVTYNVYEHSGAHTELLVHQGVQIVVH